MQKKTRFFVLTALLAFGAAFGFLKGQKVKADEVLTSALPSTAELPNFVGRRVTLVSDHEAYLLAVRKPDRMVLQVFVYTNSSMLKAQQMVKRCNVSAQGLGPIKGSLSGRRIGEEVWRPRERSGMPVGTFQLVAREGCAVVVVRGSAPSPGRDGSGRAIHGKFLNSDNKLFEDLAIGRLNKLAKMGLTR